MSSSLHQMREALGGRLRELRLTSGLSGTELARLAGWHQTKVSKIEYGKTKPTEADIRVWCDHTNAAGHFADLIATARNIEASYLEWRQVLGAGTKRRQQASMKLESNTGLMRWYEPVLIPGLLQTAEYAEEILRNVIDFYGTVDDLEAGVSKRMERQQILYQRKHKFHFVIGEQALRTTVGDDRVMVAQLDRLLAVMGMPRVSFGIVPAASRYRVPISNFIMFDNRLVMVENLTAEVSITQPRELALYGRAFDTLANQARTGSAARELITAAIASRDDI